MQEREWNAYWNGYETARALAAGELTQEEADKAKMIYTSRSTASGTAFLEGQAKYKSEQEVANK